MLYRMASVVLIVVGCSTGGPSDDLRIADVVGQIIAGTAPVPAAVVIECATVDIRLAVPTSSSGTFGATLTFRRSVTRVQSDDIPCSMNAPNAEHAVYAVVDTIHFWPSQLHPATLVRLREVP